MKLNELRVGSLFYPINRSGKVHLPIEIAFKVLTIGFKIEAIPHDKIPAQVEKWAEFNTNDLSEITLTEEWLLKFGFEKINHIHGYTFYSLSKSKLNKCHIDIYENKTQYMGYSVKHCKYVHELQNLYFALTGEEIKLN